MARRYVHTGRKQGEKIVVIIGSGFAGLNAAKELAKAEHIRVILIDKKNHHVFQPLLYQVASAALNPSDIAMPIRAQFSNSDRVDVHWGRVESISLSEKFVTVARDTLSVQAEVEIQYDFLIIATGAEHSYFGHQEWERFAPGLKTLEHATEIRRKFLSCFEYAENIFEPKLRQPYLTFVVVGGGPTGVELAGSMAEISRTVITNDFQHIEPALSKIVLIEAGPRILPSFAETLSEKAASDLKAMGVEVLTNTRVEHITAEGVTANGKHIPSRCVVWAAGVKAAALNFDPEVQKDQVGRVKVNDYLSLSQFPEVFIVGDMAHVLDRNQNLVPGVAPAAIQQGRYAAHAVLKLIKQERLTPFAYFDKGSMATIGKSKAVIQVGSLKLTGFVAWVGWLFIHILYLVGFKNRVAVLLQWVWVYMFSKRGARLITGENKP